MRPCLRLLPAAAALLSWGAALPAQEAEEAPPPELSVELNTLAPTEGGCRLSFLVRNGLGADLTRLSLETVILTVEGQVERLTLFDFGELPDGRPRVRQFDLAGLDCSAVGQVLVNGAAACEGEGVEDGACIGGLSLSSRTEAELIG